MARTAAEERGSVCTPFRRLRDRRPSGEPLECIGKPSAWCSSFPGSKLGKLDALMVTKALGILSVVEAEKGGALLADHARQFLCWWGACGSENQGQHLTLLVEMIA